MKSIIHVRRFCFRSSATCAEVVTEIVSTSLSVADKVTVGLTGVSGWDSTSARPEIVYRNEGSEMAVAAANSFFGSDVPETLFAH
jgi:hypothetical protein